MIFVDVSTATPKEKKEIASMVESRGGRFVDGAMMGALLKDRHKVSMLLSGSGAERMKQMMDPYHMRLQVVGEEAGIATSMKFIRSITAKGLSALLIESLQTAQKFGVEQLIVDSFLDSFGSGFLKIIDGYVSGAIIHAARREHEMQNVVDFLKSENLPYTMAEATREKLQWLDEKNVKGVNAANIGPMGLGGKTSVLATFIKVGNMRASGFRVVSMRPNCCMEIRKATCVWDGADK